MLLWHQARPDTINHFVLALNMVSPAAVVMMTLKHITMALQHKVLFGEETRSLDGLNEEVKTVDE